MRLSVWAPIPSDWGTYKRKFGYTQRHQLVLVPTKAGGDTVGGRRPRDGREAQGTGPADTFGWTSSLQNHETWASVA